MSLQEEILKHKFVKINGILYSVNKKPNGTIVLKIEKPL